MDLAARIQQLEELVREAKSMPLSSSALLNRDELLELVKEMQDSLPEEIKQARWVVKDREELLAKARNESEAIVAAARAEQLEKASREAVVKKAQEEAERILAEAEEEARRVRLEAEDYVDAKLAQFQVVLQRIEESLSRAGDALGKTVDQVSAGREKLRGVAIPAHELAPAEETSDDQEGAR
jgi:F0F1-type ATP synthase membrane subunit b/b'